MPIVKSLSVDTPKDIDGVTEYLINERFEL